MNGLFSGGLSISVFYDWAPETSNLPDLSWRFWSAPSYYLTGKNAESASFAAFLDLDPVSILYKKEDQDVSVTSSAMASQKEGMLKKLPKFNPTELE